MDETTAETMDACWVGQKAVLTDRPWVVQMDASMAVHSAAHSALCSVASTAVMWVDQTDASMAAQMDAS